MKQICSFCIFLLINFLSSQEIDPELLIIKERLDSIDSFQADVKLSIDIDFINMQPKHAQMTYRKNKPMEFESDDFIMIPKRGLDLSMRELFQYPFITVDRGTEKLQGTLLKKLNIIPTDSKADFAIATLWLNTEAKRIEKTEISTKKDGTFSIVMDYKMHEDILPEEVIINFEIEKIKLPIQYLGKDIDVERKKMKAQDVKTGSIHLNISNYKIEKLP
ncbi:hypothetical protein [Galbibacter mesophilus]|uniref:hypothetical protein n=1 Tax=Galbibacter mesophilus TaxID=379069 RepID=UPI00191DF06C|nr:hypothetical protein [Galbibacter mesophilus]MCM5663143.1 hypothetical protein [Galbibacter mesophilus]